MSDSTSQVEREIITLTSHIKTLEIQISSNPQPRTICHPCGPRWLSLSPYKRATRFFDQWDEHTEDLILSPPTTPEKVSRDEEVMSHSQISHFELDESEFGGKLDLLDDASCRVLGALRCYHFNLGMGTLITGERVDERVERALLKLMELSEGGYRDLTSPEKLETSGRGGGGEPSDEERLVAELEWYIMQVQSHGVEPTQDIADVARRILEWAMGHGTANGGEQF